MEQAQGNASSTPDLIWGERVQIADETHACFGRVGQYEGAICSDALRVRFPGGVIVASREQLCAIDHPAIAVRRIKAAGLRAPRPDRYRTPPCYLKDYGPTAAQRAAAAWEQGLENDDPETFRSLWNDMQRAHFAERCSRESRRLTRTAVTARQDRAAANDRRWLRTRKALRAVARAEGAAA